MYTFDSDIVSDLHKDAFGCRPGEGFWKHWNLSTNDEKQEIWDGLVAAMRRSVAEEQRRMDAAQHDFEMRVQTLQQCGARDRKMAIRWIIESLDLTEADLIYGGEYVCYRLDLPFCYQGEFDDVLQTVEVA